MADRSPGHPERLRWLEGLYGTALFARGFLLCRRDTAYLPDAWVTETVGDYRLHRDARMALHRCGEADTELVLLGDAFDLRHPELSNQEVAQQLWRALRESPAQLRARTDWIHGRYAIIYRCAGGGPRVLTDATGMRTVFHPTGGGWAGSHAALVGVNNGRRREQPPTGRFGFPGRRTPYRDVVLLVPNHELDVATGAITRFFPRDPLPEQTTAEVAEAVSRWLRQALDGILARHPNPIASLTAGLDSRTTLAVSRPVVDQLRFFTYFRGPDEDTDLADRAVAGQLAEALGLRHEVLVIADHLADRPDSFAQLCSQNSYYPHMRRTAFVYTKYFNPDTDLHLRSNLSEIGRCFYRKVKGFTEQLRTGEDLARAYLSFSPNLPAVDLAAIEADFQEYAAVTGLSGLAGLRDTRDMLYWEHRMGAWHGLAVLESDVAFQTLSLYNSRVVLDLLMSAPEHDRMSGSHLRQVIAQCWPKCLEFEVNPGRPG